MTARREVIGDCELWLGDCYEVTNEIGGADAVVSDPPYGMAWDTNTARFSGGPPATVKRRGAGGRSDWGMIVGDEGTFDPLPWLKFPQVILFGANHYAARLPVGTILVWIKRFERAFGTFLSDAEIAWMKGGCGIYCFRDLSMKGDERNRKHPSQKPLGLMQWCIKKTNGAVLDPFMGSGSTGVACARLGRRFVGIEIHEPYFEIALNRIEAAYRQRDLFIEPPRKAPEQMDLSA